MGLNAFGNNILIFNELVEISEKPSTNFFLQQGVTYHKLKLVPKLFHLPQLLHFFQVNEINFTHYYTV